MRLLLASTLFALAAGTAAAQTGTSAPLGAALTGITTPEAAPARAIGRRQPRLLDGTGDPAGKAAATKPNLAEPGAGKKAKADAAKPDAAESLRKAQAATAARDKAWDARMKRTLGSICQGC